MSEVLDSGDITPGNDLELRFKPDANPTALAHLVSLHRTGALKLAGDGAERLDMAWLTHAPIPTSNFRLTIGSWTPLSQTFFADHVAPELDMLQLVVDGH